MNDASSSGVGEILMKCSRAGKLLPRFFQLTEDLACLKWKFVGPMSSFKNKLKMGASFSKYEVLCMR